MGTQVINTTQAAIHPIINSADVRSYSSILLILYVTKDILAIYIDKKAQVRQTVTKKIL